jgi:membrane protein required for colicin V production
MNGFDLTILGVVLVFAVIGIVRGFIREVLSLTSWILSFWVAFAFAEPAARIFEPYIDAPLLRLVAAFAALFVSALLLLTIISYLLHKLLAVSGIKGTDRVLGGMFGALKGLVIVAALMLFAQETVLPEEDWWRSSVLAGHFEPLVLVIRDLLPLEMTGGSPTATS